MKYILIILSLLSTSVLAQQGKSREELIQQFMESRKKMMEQMFRAFEDDSFFNDDFFKDDNFMNDDVFKKLKGGDLGSSIRGRNVKIDERMEKDGSISVLITPLNENIKLDIDTNDKRIKITTETVEKTESDSKYGKSQSYSSSSSSQSIQVPQGYKAGTPSQEGKTIVINLKPEKSEVRNSVKKINSKTPVKKMPGEETI